jgi:hypothetical protein
LGGRITRATAGFPAIPTVSLGFTPLAATQLPYFSFRGTPCLMNGAVCTNTRPDPTGSTIAAYQIFLTDTRPTGSNGWAAVTVSPAGRIRVWMWDGSAWH